MIQINFSNIFTIALAGMLGYALLAGIPKLIALFNSSGGAGNASAA